ncbi:MAG: chemotaxis response regulator protein-glutamate methylesterase [Planctomycetota bacterium]
MKARVLIVDDSVVIRRVLSQALGSHPDIEVVGTAANGQIGLAKIAQLEPDVVTMDIEMPVLDGLETLAELRKTHPRLPVIMFSTLTERGGQATLKALSLGASDYLTKPSQTESPGEAIEQVKDDLIARILALTGRGEAPVRTPSPAPARPRDPQPGRVDIVAIGVSTGGPNALAEIFPRLPADLPVPIVLVQHMPPLFTRLLAERLDSVSPLKVSEASDGQVIAPGTAWIAPGNFHMTVERSGTDVVLRTHQGAPENSCRPAVDPLFRSVASVYGRHTLAVILTGMGQDGKKGCEVLHELGAQIIVQDRASSVVWGMPSAVALNGLAQAELPLNAIADEIGLRTRAHRTSRTRRSLASS